MKLPSVGGIESFAMLAAIAVGGYLVFKVVKGGLNLTKQVGEVVSTKLNPASDKNLVYLSANSAFFGNSSQTVGGYFYDKVHSGKNDPVAEMLKVKPQAPNTPVNGQTVRGVNNLKTSRTNTGTVDANPLVRTKAASYSAFYSDGLI